jgi:hypothetical protein
MEKEENSTVEFIDKNKIDRNTLGKFFIGG